jgi:hypothetical protein
MSFARENNALDVITTHGIIIILTPFHRLSCLFENECGMKIRKQCEMDHVVPERVSRSGCNTDPRFYHYTYRL